MIPKIIHFCWFSGDAYPHLQKKCLKTWSKHLKGYTIKCWDANSFDFDSVPFVKDAYAHRKWAFVADYIRLYALYTEGGIYLDSDVAVFDNFDRFLNNKFFAGSDLRSEGSSWYGIEAAIMGSEPGVEILKDVMAYYEKKDCFLLPDGRMSCEIIPDVMVPFFERIGYKPINETQRLDGGLTIYSTDFFTNSQCPPKKGQKVIAHHYNTATWVDYFENRGKLFNYFRKNDLMWLFSPMEKIALKIKSIIAK